MIDIEEEVTIKFNNLKLFQQSQTQQEKLLLKQTLH